jgi:hypothetical protein
MWTSGSFLNPHYFTFFSFSFICSLHLLRFNPSVAVPVPHTSSLHFSPLFTASPCAALRLFIFFVLTLVLQYFQRRLKTKSGASPPHHTDSLFFVQFAGEIFSIRRSAGQGQKGQKSSPPHAHP